jgi:hypothetical protein
MVPVEGMKNKSSTEEDESTDTHALTKTRRSRRSIQQRYQYLHIEKPLVCKASVFTLSCINVGIRDPSSINLVMSAHHIHFWPTQSASAFYSLSTPDGANLIFR